MPHPTQRNDADGDQLHDDDGRAGGDAEASGSVAEGEAVALDADEPWDSDT